MESLYATENTVLGVGSRFKSGGTADAFKYYDKGNVIAAL